MTKQLRKRWQPRFRQSAHGPLDGDAERTFEIVVDAGVRRDVTAAFAELQSSTANVNARWHFVLRLWDGSELADVLLAISLDLPREARFYIGFSLDRERRTDALIIEQLSAAERLRLTLQTSGASIEFPAPPDPTAELATALRWLDEGG